MQIPINTNAYAEINKAFFGGRVEVFNSGLGFEGVTHFDVPGLYANMMMKMLPIGNPVYLEGYNNPSLTFAEFITGLESKGLIGFFKCEVQAPIGLNIPVLPLHHDGKLTFPLGSFVGT